MYAKCSACPSSWRKVVQSVCPPCGRSTRYTSSGTRTGEQKARDALPLPLAGVERDAPGGERVDAHLAHLARESTASMRAGGKVRVERRARGTARARRRASTSAGVHAEHALRELRAARRPTCACVSRRNCLALAPRAPTSDTPLSSSNVAL